jgi:hypothetical protein
MQSLTLLKPLIEDLIGGAELEFEEGDRTEKDNKKYHSSLININQTKYRISIARNKLKLTPIEIKIFDDAIKAFETLHNSLSGDDEKFGW